MSQKVPYIKILTPTLIKLVACHKMGDNFSVNSSRDWLFTNVFVSIYDMNSLSS